MRTIRMVQTAVLALAIAGVALSADAGQTSETVNANICQNQYAPDQTALVSALNHNPNGIYNNSANYRFIDCPLQRVTATSSAGWNPAVIATDSSTQLYCVAISLDEWGNTIQSQTRTIPAGSGAKLISYPNLPSSAWGYFDFFCAMPPNSSMQSLLANEFF